MAVGEIVGPIVAGAASLFGGASANAQNLKIARENRRWQERMSNTAYQRATRDMRLAGINPMLAYMQGGASSPGGNVAEMDDVVGPAVNSALSARRLSAEMKQMERQNAKLDAERTEASAQAHLITNALFPEALQRTAESVSRADVNSAQAAFVRAQTPGARAESSRKENPVGFWIERAKRAVRSLWSVPQLHLEGGPIKVDPTLPYKYRPWDWHKQH